MNYLDKVLNYFNFSSGLIVQIGNKKRTVSISRKPKNRMIIFFSNIYINRRKIS